MTSPVITATGLADFIALRAADYAKHHTAASKGTSRLYRSLAKMHRTGELQLLLAFTKHIYRRHEAIRLVNCLSRDLVAFTRRSGLRLDRAHALQPIPDMKSTTGLLLQFSDPTAPCGRFRFVIYSLSV